MPPHPMSFARLLTALTLFLCTTRLQGSDFAMGADIGWLSQMEKSGQVFRDTSGNAKDCLEILKESGVNAVRLRVWVNPSSGWCGKDDVVAMASRASRAGLRVMIDFHYSDTWADPAHQTKPAAWAGFSLDQLKAALSTHTTEVLSTLQQAGVSPEWVQIGNETNNGMLWEEGKASVNMRAFAELVSSGSTAAKAIFPSTKVIVHVSNGWDNALFRWLFDGLRTQGASFDVIGMSLYPEKTDWLLRNEQCLANMKDMVSRYSKEVMISEVGMGVGYAPQCKAFLTDLIAKTRSLDGGRGLGVFYWEPAAVPGWQGYQKGAFDTNGKPTLAMQAFSLPAPTTSGDRFVNISTRSWVGTVWSKQVAGFVIGGSAPRKVLIRAIGPTLAGYQVPSVLSDPILDLYEGQTNSVIATNDNWSENSVLSGPIRQAFTDTGAFLLDTGSKDACLLLTLAPGTYTVEVRGVGDVTGHCLVEVYDAQ